MHRLRITVKTLQVNLFVGVAHKMRNAPVLFGDQIFYGTAGALLVIHQELIYRQGLKVVFNQKEREVHGMKMLNDRLIGI